MQAGIGELLACFHPHVPWIGQRGSANAQSRIAALMFTFGAHPWGCALTLHSDLDHETHRRWMDCDADGLPPALSLRSLHGETLRRLTNEVERRRDEVRHAEYLLEDRAMAEEAGLIKGRIGSLILRNARHQLADAQDQDWRIKDEELMSRCASVLLHEVREDDRCDVCAATGILPHVLSEDRQPIACPACHGAGVRRFSDVRRAGLMQLARSTYQRHWRTPYDWLYSEAMAARRAAVRHFRSQLGE